MRILRLDCSSGISGDMFLGALIDCGLDRRLLASGLRRVKIGKYAIAARRVKRAGISGVKFDVIYERRHAHEHTHEKTFSGISDTIRRSRLPANVRRMSLSVFTELAKAEAKAHGTVPAKVHFHEVGDIDSFVDIVGACIGIDALGIDRIYASGVTSGIGTVEVHGSVFPNPAPATAYLLEGLGVKFEQVPFELVTPTGAAILKTLCAAGSAAAGETRIIRTGYGAGSRDIPGRANLLRAMLCETLPREKDRTSAVTVIETNIDDMNPQAYGYLTEKLLSRGALDVYLTPVIMKKSRPGCVLTVIADEKDTGAVTETIFDETPTFGIRFRTCGRAVLDRKIVEVNTKYGNIRVKLGFRNGKLRTVSPEYEDCTAAAGKCGAPFAKVRRAAEAAALRDKGEKVGL